jgi:hypothetical protein
MADIIIYLLAACNSRSNPLSDSLAAAAAI